MFDYLLFGPAQTLLRFLSWNFLSTYRHNVHERFYLYHFSTYRKIGVLYVFVIISLKVSRSWDSSPSSSSSTEASPSYNLGWELILEYIATSHSKSVLRKRYYASLQISKRVVLILWANKLKLNLFSLSGYCVKPRRKRLFLDCVSLGRLFPRANFWFFPFATILNDFSIISSG